LAVAAQNGQTEIVRRLLRDGRVSSFRIGESALVNAAVAGHVEVLALLLHHLREGSLYANIALVKAAEAGQMSSVLALLPRCDGFGVGRALATAVTKGCRDVVELLSRQCEPSELALAVKAAADSDQSELLETLLAKCAPDEELSWPARQSIRGSFVSAAKRGKCAVVKLLAARWVKETFLSYEALEQAAAHHHIEVVGILLDALHSKGIVMASDRARGIALAGNDVEMLELLVQHLSKYTIGSALTKATIREAVKVLAEKSAQYCIGLAVVDAAVHGRAESLGVLLEYADQASIHQAVTKVASAGKLQAAIELLKRCDCGGCMDVFNTSAKEGITGLVQFMLGRVDASDARIGLTQAAANGHVDIVKLLLERSESRDISVALEKAAEGGHQDVVSLLRDWCDTTTVTTLTSTLKRASDAGAASCLDTKRVRLE